MKQIDLMKMDEDKGQMAGVYAYIFYGDAKKAGLRQGDEVQVTMNDQPLDDSIYIVDEYLNFRSDMNRTFKGFRLVKKSFRASVEDNNA